MLFIHPAVAPADDVAAPVAQVQKVTRAPRALPTWTGAVELAQLQTAPSSNAAQNQAAPGTSIGGTPPITNPNNGNATPPNPVGAAPPIPGDTSNPAGNTYGTQQERSGASGVTAPVTPGVPGPGAGTGGSSGSGMAAPELARPPAGNMDSGSSYQNLSSPYNSSGSGAGLTGTGMGTTATPPSAGTTATPGSTPPPSSGASGTR
jgi:hypothetical protein